MALTLIMKIMLQDKVSPIDMICSRNPNLSACKYDRKELDAISHQTNFPFFADQSLTRLGYCSNYGLQFMKLCHSSKLQRNSNLKLCTHFESICDVKNGKPSIEVN